jgi:hypothetical protein
MTFKNQFNRFSFVAVILSVFTAVFMTITADAQTSLVNVKAGTWKNADTWLYQRVPTDSDDVVLLQDIVIDTNAFCRSLTTNGYNITVASGLHLTITGNDSTPGVIDNDTLIAALKVSYYGTTSTGTVTDQDYEVYEYDSLKRVLQKVTYAGFEKDTLTYYYLQNSPNPYKTIYRNPCDFQSNGKCIPQNDTSYYKYNADGIVIQDSSRSLESVYSLNYKRTYDYTIFGDSVIRYGLTNTFVINSPNVYELFRNDTTYYSRVMTNGNIVHQVAYNRDWESEHIFSQDHATNPLYRGSIHLPVLPLEMLLLEGPEQINNNLTHEENYSFSGYTQQIKYRSAYRYRRDGFPSEFVLLDELNDQLIIFKYQYTH